MAKKFNSQTLFGNIYQRFEAVCQEVDDFVNKDSVRYIENHVQSVGRTVKSFCSGVQDSLPSLKDPVKHVAQAAPLKQIDPIVAYTESTLGMTEGSADTVRKQSSGEAVPSSPVESYRTPKFPALTHEKHFNVPCDGYGSEETDTSLCSGRIVDVFLNDSAVMGLEVHIKTGKPLTEAAMEVQSPCEGLSYAIHDNSSTAYIYEECVNFNYLNENQAKASLATLTNNFEHRSSEEGTLSTISSECDALTSTKPNSSVEAIEDMDMAVTDNGMEYALSPCENVSSQEHISLSVASEYNNPVDDKHSGENLAQVSRSLVDNGSGYTQEERTPHTGFFYGADHVSNSSSTHQSSELEFSMVYCESNVEQISQRDLPTESCNQSKSSHEDLVEEEFFDDINITGTSEDVSLSGSSGTKCEQYSNCSQVEASISSLEVDAEDNTTVDVEDFGMETINLSDNVQPGETSVLIGGNPLYAFSSRRARSYKKIIQDAFASRKRLTKEYEQLAIWCGDIDTELSQLPKQNNSFTIATISSELKESQAGDLHVSGWELL